MSRLILMRHGQASFGAERYDCLSGLGCLQARVTGRWMKDNGRSPSVLLHGPRRRQEETARLLLEESCFPVSLLKHDGLDEFAEGEEIFKAAELHLGRTMREGAGRSRPEVMRDYDATCNAWSLGQIQFEGRRSVDQFRSHVRHWFHDLIVQPDLAGQQVIAVTSAGVISALVCEVLDLPSEKWHSFLRVIGNASLTEVLFSNGRFGLLSFNGLGHLPKDLNSSM